MAAALLDKQDFNALSDRIRHWVEQRHISRRIDLYGCLFYVKDGRYQDQSADQFRNLIGDLASYADVKFWASRSKGKMARLPLARLGVDEDSLDRLFDNSEFADLVRETWSSAPRPGDFGGDSTDRPVILRI